MKNLAKDLLFMDTHDSLVRVFQSWRLWMLGALVGALLAVGVYTVFPPDWRARAVVVVDFNMEEFLSIPPGKQFYFLGREARKLQELAFSDATLQLVSDRLGNVSVRELREEILSLSQPDDGGWHFFADSRDPDEAALIASTWAQAFYEQTLDGIEFSVALDQYRKEVSRLFEENPDMSGGEVDHKATELVPMIQNSKGITPYIELTLSQHDNLVTVRKVPLSVYILVGSIIGACASAFTALTLLRKEEQDAFPAE